MAVAAALVVMAAPCAGAAEQPERVVLYSIPGITWEDVLAAPTPVLDGLIDDGAVSANVVRSAVWRTNVVRGYATLGAGQRAVGQSDETGRVALAADAAYENGTAAEAVARRNPGARIGGIVHPELTRLASSSGDEDYGAEPGALGEALARAGIGRAVITAADIATEPDEDEMRRAAVLGIADRSGTVDTGALDGLVRREPTAPFGIATDRAAFVSAVSRALRDAQVVLVDPGETQRADEYASLTQPEQADRMRLSALTRADELLGEIVEQLGPRDMLFVVVPSSPKDGSRDTLTPLVAHGPGVEPGWLGAPTTRRDGLTQLTDVAPTILDALGIPQPVAMTGAPMTSVASGSIDRPAHLADLDRLTDVHATFAPIAAGVLIGLISVMAILTFVTFLSPARPGRTWLLTSTYAVLAVAPAATIVRALSLDASTAAATVSFVVTVAVLAAAARLVPGHRLAGGVVLLLLSVAINAGDLLARAPFQPNSAFGGSPVVGGRFYGIGNPGHAILISAAILGLTALAELRRQDRLPHWSGAALVAVVLIVGLPGFGANFGGFVSGSAAVAVAYGLARRARIRWSWLAGVAIGVVVLAVGLALLDMSRDPTERTHLGRFAALVASGGFGGALTTIQRKASAAVGTLGFTRWTYVIPLSAAVLALLLYKPSGVLRDVIPKHPVLRAGLVGALAHGIVGFATNDSGVVIPALVLVHAVPLLVLMALEAQRETVPSSASVDSRRTATPILDP